MDLNELEIDVRYNSNKDKYVTINDNVYTVQEAYSIARKLFLASSEIFSYVDNEIERRLNEN